MRAWSITLHGPSGVSGPISTGETQFVLGSETSHDVLTLSGGAVQPRHAMVWIAQDGMQVESLGGETLVNGHLITGRVQTAYPASVQLGEVTVVVEVNAVDPSTAVTVLNPPTGNSYSREDLAVRQGGGVGMRMVAAHRGEYRLLREIARGGMGQIYFGEDPQLERTVAVKVSSLSEGGEDLRFSKEARVLALLAHPNIVPIYATGLDAHGRPFYSMKLVEGRTLQAVLNALKEGDAAAMREYPQGALLTIFRKVCDAMAFAHAKGILHRDLKPENIMVGQYGEVLVMDWGLAKILGERDEGGTVKTGLSDTGDYGMTIEGEVMGTPQYMSPEQAEGRVAQLDIRSDVYSLGGILYAILTLCPPVEGSTLAQVLGNVKSGVLTPMETAGKVPRGIGGRSAPMSVAVPAALRAVTLKAMALDREKRYASVALFSADIDAYLNGFATSAEEAGTWRRAKLWVLRNRMLAGAATVLVLVVGGFTARVIQKGREASDALRSLRETAPTFAMRAQDALREGQFVEALGAATFAVKLEPGHGEYHALRGNVLQVLLRWPEAVEAYQTALRFGASENARDNLGLTESLIVQAKKEDETRAKAALFAALNQRGRQYEALAFAKELGDFWSTRKKDPVAVPELVRRLEAKLLPVPGTGVLLSKTEVTVGEWKLYLRAEGLPEWVQPTKDWEQTDDHPVVNVSWNDAQKFCEWISKMTGKEWRLPKSAEWDAAVGNSVYPWGDYFPPKWDDGNYGYGVTDSGKAYPKGKTPGVDGILGTAPVGSFKGNVLGFYDLGGNVSEWMSDGIGEKAGSGKRLIRGATGVAIQSSTAPRRSVLVTTRGTGACLTAFGLLWFGSEWASGGFEGTKALPRRQRCGPHLVILWTIAAASSGWGQSSSLPKETTGEGA